jgi:uncharacterized protein (TIGR02391 family)
MIPKIDTAILEKVCRILGDTTSGLTGSEIGRYLRECGIPDDSPTITKRDRLFAALSEKQRLDHCANNVCAFIERVMSPVIHTGDGDYFETTRSQLNLVLAFAGLMLSEEGKITKSRTARTLTDASEIANRLRSQLEQRGVHSEVLRFCNAELLSENYFHAVLEASKSVAQRIRDISGCTSDGSALVDEAFGVGSKAFPLVAFNSMRTESEQSEHKGLMNLIKGFFGVFRNTTAHAPKITWTITEEDALDMLTLASLLQRRLAVAVKTPQPPSA